MNATEALTVLLVRTEPNGPVELQISYGGHAVHHRIILRQGQLANLALDAVKFCLERKLTLDRREMWETEFQYPERITG